MVVGERVSVTTKMKAPNVIHWESQILMACNRLPAFKDKGGSLKRRLFIVEFMHVISDVNPNLFEEMLAYLDKFLFVITQSYATLVNRYASRTFLDCAPSLFKDAVVKHVQSNDPLCSFLNECCTFQGVDDEDNLCVDIQTFKQAFKKYAMDNNYPRVSMTDHAYTQTLGQYGAHVEHRTEAGERPGKYITRLCLNEIGQRLCN